MKAAFSKAEIESEVASRFGDAFKLHEKRPAEVVSTGISEINSFIGGGLPRGSITEISGPASSGRTSFLLSVMAHATTHNEVCALVDTSNTFDPGSAANTSMDFERLLWIRCANNLEHAFKATDLLLQGGGFGLVMLDLGDVPTKDAKRIISSWWYRFRRTLESTPTVMVVITEESCAKSCAALALELKQESGLWSSNSGRANVSEFKIPGKSRPPTSFGWRNIPFPHANLMQGLQFQIKCHRPLHLTGRDEVVVKVANGNDLAPPDRLA